MSFVTNLVSKFNRKPTTEHKIVHAVSQELVNSAKMETEAVLKNLHTIISGLTAKESARRLVVYGSNEIASGKHLSWLRRLFSNIEDPLSLLLLALGIISYFTGDIKATFLIGLMLVLSVLLRFFQEVKATAAAEKLKAMVHTTACVVREGIQKEIPLKLVVPGDIIHLSAGDIVPADVRILESRDLFINQSALTGESLPVEKHAPKIFSVTGSEFEIQNLCFMGTAVESGTAVTVAVATGVATYFGSLAKSIVGERELTSFDKGIGRFTWLMIRFIGVMVPLVFLINGFSKGNWLEAFLFALAVAVGLTPEMLPMIVTVNLSKGALDMSRKKVIVKRLNAIQNFGAMDVLCTDKTGTLTQGKVILIKHVDIAGHENENILNYAYLNSFYQTGLKNLMDTGVLKHAPGRSRVLEKEYTKVDELPFDFVRRRMSVVVENKAGKHLLICKGAVEEVLSCSTRVVEDGKTHILKKTHHKNKQDLVTKLSSEGFRLIAIAYRELPPAKRVYKTEDESNLTLLGFLAFLDPAKESAGVAIKELNRYGVQVKILTGDNELVTRKICSDVDLKINRILLGSEIEKMTDDELTETVEQTTIFDKLEPAHKERVIRALQHKGHVVGFLGDGINDAPALKAADVGISVDTAADIAKESSDIILLEKNLLVLKDGAREGRKIFGNIVKYIKMAASSNFGNMFSVVGGSIFLPFLPMLPIQIIANNLLYDLSQAAIPTDSVDEEYLTKPRQWHINQIKRYMLFIGPISSIFDYITFFMMLFVFNTWLNPALFQTGWFFESLLTQTMIVHIIRTNKIPFFQSRAGWPLTLSTIGVVGIGAWLPFSPLASSLGFVPLPALYWLLVGAMLVCYFVLTQIVKRWFTRRYADD